jgi:hypothetical protein
LAQSSWQIELTFPERKWETHSTHLH